MNSNDLQCTPLGGHRRGPRGACRRSFARNRIENWSGNSVYGAASVPVTVARDSAPVPLGAFANGFASVLKPALPAVVNIHTSKIVKPKANRDDAVLQ